MSYLVLARKWRPRSFDTLVGQEHVVRALTHALSTRRLHHAWLFTGTRGVGKTTLARILAKSLNCETGITAQPCGVCRACTEIDGGRFVDYVELDAASNRGVDEMTQLLEQAVYAPASGRFKVYMIDEVHMLTGHAFNAMLKTLEEPPAHVKFILATTDPQKIPVTVLSRCLQFNLKQMAPDAIVGHLQTVLAQEGLVFERPALHLLARAAGGSMRDALSLTDQAIAYSAGNLSEDAVRGMLGAIDQRYLLRLLQALMDGSATGILAIADELAERGLSYAGALADLAGLLSNMAILQRVPDAPVASVGGADGQLAADVQALAQRAAPDWVQLCYTVAIHSRGELALAPDEYAGFMMACLRMLAFSQTAAPAVAAVAAAPVSALPTEPAEEVPEAVSEEAQQAAQWQEQRLEPELSLQEPAPPPYIPQPPEAVHTAAVHAAPPTPAASPAPSDTTSALNALTAADWPALAARLPLSGWAAELARQSEWVGIQDNRLCLRVALQSPDQGAGRDRLQAVLSEHFGQPIRLDIATGQTGQHTAHAVAQAQADARRQQAEQAIAQDETVQAFIQTFDASIIAGSIQIDEQQIAEQGRTS